MLRSPVFAVFAAFAALSCAFATRAQPQTEEQKLIHLVEDRLASAYTLNRLRRAPDYSVLDRIFPSWDGNKPAEARKRWVNNNYSSYRVSYRVDSVYIGASGVAELTGKKQTRAEQIIKHKKYRAIEWADIKSGNWPLHGNKVVKKHTPWQKFKITAQKNEKGKWRILSEHIH